MMTTLQVLLLLIALAAIVLVTYVMAFLHGAHHASQEERYQAKVARDTYSVFFDPLRDVDPAHFRDPGRPA